MKILKEILKRIKAILAVAFSGIGVAIWLNWNVVGPIFISVFSGIKLSFLLVISFIIHWWYIELIIILIGVIAYLLLKLNKYQKIINPPQKNGLQWILSLENSERMKLLVLYWFPIYNLLESPRFKVVEKLIGMAVPFESTPIYHDLIEHQVLEYKQDIMVEYYFKIDREVYKYYEQKLKELTEENRNNLIEIMRNTRFDYLFDNNIVSACYKKNT
jgi:hypothetical protein